MVCVGSKIPMNRAKLTLAYRQNNGSKFVMHMCYGLFGYKELSVACLRKQKNTQDQTVLSQKKKRVIQEHFQYWMATQGYPKHTILIELSKFHNYIHNAITSSRRKLKNCGNIPDQPEYDDDEDVEL